MVPHTLMPTLLVLGLLAIGAGSSAQAQSARTTAKDALGAFPCPSGDASCGNGSPSTSTKSPPINGVSHKQAQKKIAPQNSLPDSNPNQKIEGPSGPVDEGVTRDLQEMNREGGAHEVNRPK